MDVQEHSKAVFYEFNPRQFRDANGDGVGDLRGVIEKFDYFTFLGVNSLILQGALATEAPGPSQSFLELAPELGTLEDFDELIARAKQHHIQVFFELSLSTISPTSKWFAAAATSKTSPFHDLVQFSEIQVNAPKETNLVSAENEKTGEFFLRDATTSAVPLNWDSPLVSEHFVKVIKSWVARGLTGFVLKDFERLGVSPMAFTTPNFNPLTLNILAAFYAAVKKAVPRAVLIGKSAKAPLEAINEYTQDSTRLFDFFYPLNLSLLGTKGNSPDALGEFDQRELGRALAIVAPNPRNIVAFGSAHVGRVASRWGDEHLQHDASVRALAIALLFGRAASLIYYGDELGMKNIGLSAVDDFQDASLEIRKKAQVNARHSETRFMAAQIKQNPINAHNVMPWNNTKHGGFSASDKVTAPLPQAYGHINVASMYYEPTSPLNFYRALIHTVTVSPYAPVIAQSVMNVNVLPSGVLHLRFKAAPTTLDVYLNLSNETRRLRLAPSFLASRASTLVTSYTTGTYGPQLPAVLGPYEALVRTKHPLAPIEVTAPERPAPRTKTKTPELSELESSLLQEEQTRPATTRTVAVKTPPRPAVREATGVVAAKLGRVATRDLPLATKGIKTATSALSRAKAEALRADAALQQVQGEGPTRLRDAQVAKTTQVSVDETDDIEAFLRALDKRRK